MSLESLISDKVSTMLDKTHQVGEALRREQLESVGDFFENAVHRRVELREPTLMLGLAQKSDEQ